MKRKIFLGAGAFLLASVGVLAGRASAKFLNAPAFYVSDGAGVCIPVNTSLSNSHFTTNSVGSGEQATLKTASGTPRKVYWTSGCASKPLYFQ